MASMNWKRLVLVFWSWKLLLLLVAVASPGPGYDTSTRILLDRYPASTSSTSSAPPAWPARLVERLVANLLRWDSIYFTTSSVRGHLFEQEWAFSKPAAQLNALVARVLPSSLCTTSPVTCHAFTGILISHVAHFLAVLTLYQLTRTLVPCNPDTKRRIAFTTTCLHTISPGGLFLSSFNGEASFALCNFLGMGSYLLAQKRIHSPAANAFYLITAGIAFAVASTIRSNGLLSGLVLAADALAYVPRLNTLFHDQHLGRELVRLSATLLAGSLIALGYILPQIEAYREYCTHGTTRPWCARLLPSIYTWVQSHYWGVGFLRYWTLSNAPLFALATPMVVVLLGTGWVAVGRQSALATTVRQIDGRGSSSSNDRAADEEVSVFTRTMVRFALPQLVLAVLATTNFHVQIINRISSGYPVWYIVLAIAIHAGDVSSGKGEGLAWLRRRSQWAVRASVMYAIIQGGLYASFMPPA